MRKLSLGNIPPTTDIAAFLQWTVSAFDEIQRASHEGGELTAIVQDLEPELGGDLDLNSNSITGNGSIQIAGNMEAVGGNFTGVHALLSGNVLASGDVHGAKGEFSDKLGYATGAGGAVTQATSRTTGVTLDTVTGAIALVSAAGSATPASFTVTNATVEATDVIQLNQKSGADKYVLLVTAIAAGSFEVTFYTTGGTTTEQPVFNFAVIKGVAA